MNARTSPLPQQRNIITSRQVLIASALLIAAGIIAIGVVRFGGDWFRDSGTRTITSTDNGTAIVLDRGDELVIRLDSNPTTGFSWGVETLDDRVMTFTRSDYEGPQSAVVGQGGTEVLYFLAGQAGQTDLTLRYWRPFEGDASTIERYTVTVTVR